MSNRTLTILVIISLAFNIAFLGGFIYMRIKGPGTPPPPFFPRQKQSRINQMFFEKREIIKSLTDQNHNDKLSFFKELASENCDNKTLNSKLDKSLQSQYELDKEIGDNLIKLRSNLNPEEAEKIFGNMIRNNKQPKRRRFNGIKEER